MDKIFDTGTTGVTPMASSTSVSNPQQIPSEPSSLSLSSNNNNSSNYLNIASTPTPSNCANSPTNNNNNNTGLILPSNSSSTVASNYFGANNNSNSNSNNNTNNNSTSSLNLNNLTNANMNTNTNTAVINQNSMAFYDFSDQELMNNDNKYKQYALAIDKALKSFEYTSEWADLVNALGKLNRVLQSNSKYAKIPRRFIVGQRLAQCMHPLLPSGVHLKALETYDLIFRCLGKEQLLADLTIYSNGLFPLLSYAGINVRPTVLELFEQHLVPLGENLRLALDGFLISILPCYEESSDLFQCTDSLLVKAATGVGETYFYGSLWRCILQYSSIRLSAITFISMHFNKKRSLTEQAHILGTDMRTLVRAICAALLDTSILVQRAILDLLITIFPVHLNIMNEMEDAMSSPPAHQQQQPISRNEQSGASSSTSQPPPQVNITSPSRQHGSPSMGTNTVLKRKYFKKPELIAIITAALTVLLRRDLSLNRRLCAWFFGSDTNSSTSSGPGGKNGSGASISSSSSAAINSKYSSNQHSSSNLSTSKSSKTFSTSVPGGSSSGGTSTTNKESASEAKARRKKINYFESYCKDLVIEAFKRCITNPLTAITSILPPDALTNSFITFTLPYVPDTSNGMTMATSGHDLTSTSPSTSQTSLNRHTPFMMNRHHHHNQQQHNHHHRNVMSNFTNKTMKHSNLLTLDGSGGDASMPYNSTVSTFWPYRLLNCMWDNQRDIAQPLMEILCVDILRGLYHEFELLTMDIPPPTTTNTNADGTDNFDEQEDFDEQHTEQDDDEQQKLDSIKQHHKTMMMFQQNFPSFLHENESTTTLSSSSLISAKQKTETSINKEKKSFIDSGEVKKSFDKKKKTKKPKHQKKIKRKLKSPIGSRKSMTTNEQYNSSNVSLDETNKHEIKTPGKLVKVVKDEQQDINDNSLSNQNEQQLSEEFGEESVTQNSLNVSADDEEEEEEEEEEEYKSFEESVSGAGGGVGSPQIKHCDTTSSGEIGDEDEEIKANVVLGNNDDDGGDNEQQQGIEKARSGDDDNEFMDSATTSAPDTIVDEDGADGSNEPNSKKKIKKKKFKLGEKLRSSVRRKSKKDNATNLSENKVPKSKNTVLNKEPKSDKNQNQSQQDQQTLLVNKRNINPFRHIQRHVFHRITSLTFPVACNSDNSDNKIPRKQKGQQKILLRLQQKPQQQQQQQQGNKMKTVMKTFMPKQLKLKKANNDQSNDTNTITSPASRFVKRFSRYRNRNRTPLTTAKMDQNNTKQTSMALSSPPPTTTTTTPIDNITFRDNVSGFINDNDNDNHLTEQQLRRQQDEDDLIFLLPHQHYYWNPYYQQLNKHQRLELLKELDRVMHLLFSNMGVDFIWTKLARIFEYAIEETIMLKNTLDMIVKKTTRDTYQTHHHHHHHQSQLQKQKRAKSTKRSKKSNRSKSSQIRTATSPQFDDDPNSNEEGEGVADSYEYDEDYRDVVLQQPKPIDTETSSSIGEPKQQTNDDEILVGHEEIEVEELEYSTNNDDDVGGEDIDWNDSDTSFSPSGEFESDIEETDDAPEALEHLQQDNDEECFECIEDAINCIEETTFNNWIKQKCQKYFYKIIEDLCRTQQQQQQQSLNQHEQDKSLDDENPESACSTRSSSFETPEVSPYKSSVGAGGGGGSSRITNDGTTASGSEIISIIMQWLAEEEIDFDLYLDEQQQHSEQDIDGEMNVLLLIESLLKNKLQCSLNQHCRQCGQRLNFSSPVQPVGTESRTILEACTLTRFILGDSQPFTPAYYVQHKSCCSSGKHHQNIISPIILFDLGKSKCSTPSNSSGSELLANSISVSMNRNNIFGGGKNEKFFGSALEPLAVDTMNYSYIIRFTDHVLQLMSQSLRSFNILDLRASVELCLALSAKLKPAIMQTFLSSYRQVVLESKSDNQSINTVSGHSRKPSLTIWFQNYGQPTTTQQATSTQQQANSNNDQTSISCSLSDLTVTNGPTSTPPPHTKTHHRSASNASSASLKFSSKKLEQVKEEHEEDDDNSTITSANSINEKKSQTQQQQPSEEQQLELDDFQLESVANGVLEFFATFIETIMIKKKTTTTTTTNNNNNNNNNSVSSDTRSLIFDYYYNQIINKHPSQPILHNPRHFGQQIRHQLLPIYQLLCELLIEIGTMPLLSSPAFLLKTQDQKLFKDQLNSINIKECLQMITTSAQQNDTAISQNAIQEYDKLFHHIRWFIYLMVLSADGLYSCSHLHNNQDSSMSSETCCRLRHVSYTSLSTILDLMTITRAYVISQPESLSCGSQMLLQQQEQSTSSSSGTLTALTNFCVPSYVDMSRLDVFPSTFVARRLNFYPLIHTKLLQHVYTDCMGWFRLIASGLWSNLQQSDSPLHHATTALIQQVHSISNDESICESVICDEMMGGGCIINNSNVLNPNLQQMTRYIQSVHLQQYGTGAAVTGGCSNISMQQIYNSRSKFILMFAILRDVRFISERLALVVTALSSMAKNTTNREDHTVSRHSSSLDFGGTVASVGSIPSNTGTGNQTNKIITQLELDVATRGVVSINTFDYGGNGGNTGENQHQQSINSSGSSTTTLTGSSSTFQPPGLSLSLNCSGSDLPALLKSTCPISPIALSTTLKRHFDRPLFIMLDSLSQRRSLSDQYSSAAIWLINCLKPFYMFGTKNLMFTSPNGFGITSEFQSPISIAYGDQMDSGSGSVTPLVHFKNGCTDIERLLEPLLFILLHPDTARLSMKHVTVREYLPNNNNNSSEHMTIGSRKIYTITPTGNGNNFIYHVCQYSPIVQQPISPSPPPPPPTINQTEEKTFKVKKFPGMASYQQQQPETNESTNNANESPSPTPPAANNQNPPKFLDPNIVGKGSKLKFSDIHLHLLFYQRRFDSNRSAYALDTILAMIDTCPSRMLYSMATTNPFRTQMMLLDGGRSAQIRMLYQRHHNSIVGDGFYPSGSSIAPPSSLQNVVNPSGAGTASASNSFTGRQRRRRSASGNAMNSNENTMNSIAADNINSNNANNIYGLNMSDNQENITLLEMIIQICLQYLRSYYPSFPADMTTTTSKTKWKSAPGALLEELFSNFTDSSNCIDEEAILGNQRVRLLAAQILRVIFYHLSQMIEVHKDYNVGGGGKSHHYHHSSATSGHSSSSASGSSLHHHHHHHKRQPSESLLTFSQSRTFAQYISELMARCNVQQIVLQCLVTSIWHYEEKFKYQQQQLNNKDNRKGQQSDMTGGSFQGSFLFRQITSSTLEQSRQNQQDVQFIREILDYNDYIGNRIPINIYDEQQEQHQHGFHDEFECSLLQLLEHVMILESRIHAIISTTTTSNSGKSTSDSTTGSILSNHPASLQKTDLMRMSFYPELPVAGQPLLNGALQYALLQNFRRHVHSEWLSFVESSLHYAGRYMARLVLTVINQLCKNLESCCQEIDRFASSTRFTTPTNRQGSSQIVPPFIYKHFLNTLNGISMIYSYCLLDRNQFELLSPVLHEMYENAQMGFALSFGLLSRGNYRDIDSHYVSMDGVRSLGGVNGVNSASSTSGGGAIQALSSIFHNIMTISSSTSGANTNGTGSVNAGNASSGGAGQSGSSPTQDQHQDDASTPTISMALSGGTSSSGAGNSNDNLSNNLSLTRQRILDYTSLNRVITALFNVYRCMVDDNSPLEPEVNDPQMIDQHSMSSCCHTYLRHLNPTYPNSTATANTTPQQQYEKYLKHQRYQQSNCMLGWSSSIYTGWYILGSSSQIRRSILTILNIITVSNGVSLMKSIARVWHDLRDRNQNTNVTGTGAGAAGGGMVLTDNHLLTYDLDLVVSPVTANQQKLVQLIASLTPLDLEYLIQIVRAILKPNSSPSTSTSRSNTGGSSSSTTSSASTITTEVESTEHTFTMNPFDNIFLIEVSLLEFFLAYIRTLPGESLLKSCRSLVTLIKDGFALNLSASVPLETIWPRQKTGTGITQQAIPSQSVQINFQPLINIYLLAIIHEFAITTPLVDDRRSQKELQDVAQKLIDANIMVAGGRLLPSKFWLLRRNFEVMPMSQSDMAAMLANRRASPTSLVNLNISNTSRTSNAADTSAEEDQQPPAPNSQQMVTIKRSLFRHSVSIHFHDQRKPSTPEPQPNSNADASSTSEGVFSLFTNILSSGSGGHSHQQSSGHHQHQDLTITSQNMFYSYFCIKSLYAMAEFAAPVLDVVYASEEKEKMIPLITNLMNYVTPYLKSHSQHNIPCFDACSRILASLSGYQYTRKAWRRETMDLLLDPSFFQMLPECLRSWRTIIDHLMTHDKNTFREFLGRVSNVGQSPSVSLKMFVPSSSGSSGSGKDPESEPRAQLVKRLAFILFCSEKDQYQKYMAEIQEKLIEIHRTSQQQTSSNTQLSMQQLQQQSLLQSQVLLAFRVILLRMSPHYFSSLWPFIYTEMFQVFLTIEQQLLKVIRDEQQHRKLSSVGTVTSGMQQQQQQQQMATDISSQASTSRLDSLTSAQISKDLDSLPDSLFCTNYLQMFSKQQRRMSAYSGNNSRNTSITGRQRLDPKIPPAQLQLFLNACKLLDLALLLPSDTLPQFQLHKWAFISDPGACHTTTNTEPTNFASSIPRNQSNLSSTIVQQQQQQQGSNADDHQPSSLNIDQSSPTTETETVITSVDELASAITEIIYTNVKSFSLAAHLETTSINSSTMGYNEQLSSSGPLSLPVNLNVNSITNSNTSGTGSHSTGANTPTTTTTSTGNIIMSTGSVNATNRTESSNNLSINDSQQQASASSSSSSSTSYSTFIPHIVFINNLLNYLSDSPPCMSGVSGASLCQPLLTISSIESIHDLHPFFHCLLLRANHMWSTKYSKKNYSTTTPMAGARNGSEDQQDKRKSADTSSVYSGSSGGGESKKTRRSTMTTVPGVDQTDQHQNVNDEDESQFGVCSLDELFINIDRIIANDFLEPLPQLQTPSSATQLD